MEKKFEENSDYEYGFQKRGKSNKIKNYYILGGLLLLFIISFSIFFYPQQNKTTLNENAALVCGDGTFYSDCSINRPYFCNGGRLIYNSEKCGCPEGFNKEQNECNIKYFDKKVNFSLKYFLNGAESTLNFEMGAGLSEYLDKKDRTMTYLGTEIPRRADFKFIKINDEIQRESLMDIVVKIQNAAPNSLVDQARIATSLVQNIEYKESEFANVTNFGSYGFSNKNNRNLGLSTRIAKYPYQVVERGLGSCEGKSELLVFLLREIGYGTAVLYYQDKNHEAVGIKCPIEKSLDNSGYCFIETTTPAPMTYSTGKYLIGDSVQESLGKPEIDILSKGISLPENLIEYKDVKKIEKILNDSSTTIAERRDLNLIYKKYGMSKLEVF